MGKLRDEVVPAASADPTMIDSTEERPPRPGVVPGEKGTEEKPRVSGEIVIEEISIDGMCGVY